MRNWWDICLWYYNSNPLPHPVPGGAKVYLHCRLISGAARILPCFNHRILAQGVIKRFRDQKCTSCFSHDVIWLTPRRSHSCLNVKGHILYSVIKQLMYPVYSLLRLSSSILSNPLAPVQCSADLSLGYYGNFINFMLVKCFHSTSIDFSNKIGKWDR